MYLRRRIVFFSFVVVIIFVYIWWTRKDDYLQIGWEGNVSRNASDYISESLPPHLFRKRFCVERKLLLVMVTSRPDGFEARRAIRDTWGQQHPNVSFFFLLGEIKDEAVQLSLMSESQKFGDIIQERFLDTYNNLTLKSINMLKLFKIHCTHTHRYLMKVDDDLFLNVPLVLKTLSKRKKHENVLFGRVRDTVPLRVKGSKWYMSYEIYPYDKYPLYLCGPGYLMSADVVEKLYFCALHVPFLHLEDVFLTGVCADIMKIKHTNSFSFTCNALSRSICHYRHLYTLHYFSPDDIRESYQLLDKNLCSHYAEFSVVMRMIFFLGVP